MTSTDARAISPTNGQVTTGCVACAHPWSAHDRIAARFCNATAAGGHQRGCVCTVRPSTGPTDKTDSSTG